MSNGKHIKIIFESFDNASGKAPALVFVEINDDSGKSIRVGNWTADGEHEALIISVDDLRAALGE